MRRYILMARFFYLTRAQRGARISPAMIHVGKIRLLPLHQSLPTFIVITPLSLRFAEESRYDMWFVALV
jgi:hypothetical protein